MHMILPLTKKHLSDTSKDRIILAEGVALLEGDYYASTLDCDLSQHIAVISLSRLSLSKLLRFSHEFRWARTPRWHA